MLARFRGPIMDGLTVFRPVEICSYPRFPNARDRGHPHLWLVRTFETVAARRLYDKVNRRSVWVGGLARSRQSRFAAV